MKEERIENLIKKYQAGASTLDEEQFLFNNSEKSEPTMEAWSAFVKRNKNEAPQNLNGKLWHSFRNRRNKKRRFLFGTVSAAASVLLIIAVITFIPEQKKLSYAEKEAILNQVQDLFAGTEQDVIQQSIIYENEMIVIYTSSE